jgi:zinc/manganese transport system substrate-binding protein
MGANMQRRRIVVTAVLAAALVAAGCSRQQPAESDDGPPAAGRVLNVVATTTQVADFVRAVGGRDVSVTQILQPNTDAHGYEPRPDDVKATAGAKLAFASGDGLDDWMADLVEDSGASLEQVDLGMAVPVRRPDDPHWWHDPRNARAAVAEIADTLGRAEPAKRAAFERNARAYSAKLRALDRGIRRCVAGVPRDERKLVTDHDAFNHFADRYGIEVVGAVIPSQTTQAQPSAGDLAELSRLVREQGVRAVFPESSVNPRLARAIARETGASAEYTLYGDSLGPRGSSGATYLTMEEANADAMVRGFTGGKRGCSIPGIG